MITRLTVYRPKTKNLIYKTRKKLRKADSTVGALSGP